ncbi:MAG: hypothetical protein MMC33_006773 [Icmadophila ericetorum]|nr:hypothetical protein [Icmadophila ericetorum]
MASDPLKTPGFFTAAIQADNENPFEASFQSGSYESSKLDAPASRESNNFFHSLSQDNYPSIFGFSPQTSPAPFKHNAQSSSWTTLKPNTFSQYTAAAHQRPLELSPPSSVKGSPSSWSYNDIQMPPLMTAPHHLLTQNHPSQSRLQYGQITPQDDFEDEEQQRFQVQGQEQGDQSTKRKRASTVSNEVVQPAKRSRKSTRGKGATQKSASPLDPEGDKRSKFLERNRVAASKCRQKKKEWTSNLEARARELQNSKNQLQMMVSSLKDEVMFLKGEMFKHTGCGCVQIRDYLSREANNLTKYSHNAYQPFDSAASPIGAAPNSRLQSVSGTSIHRDSRQGSIDSLKNSSPLVNMKTEDDLEALLTGTLVQDTSDGGIASRIDS